MTDVLNITSLFDKVLTGVTCVLTNISLKRIELPGKRFPNGGYRISVHTMGNFDAYFVCEIDRLLYEDIIAGMHGGTSPRQEEKMLYMFEYMNIICGRVVSIVNNMTGNASKLSVPVSRSDKEDRSRIQGKEIGQPLYYRAETGYMQIEIYYTLH